ncbi:MAG: HD-GYP domain-containing protein [Ilumatobacteraceae bacterium]|nr:HD-GYP domain-containing protein [Ilumatobacteraceae bacterium]
MPFLCSILAALTLSTLIPMADSRPVAVMRLIAIAAVSTVVLYGADRLTRRMLPLAALLGLTLVFPDEAPSRFKIAMRSGGTVELQRRLEEYRRIGANEPALAAQRLLELVADLSQHDRLTRGHSERVRAYSQMIGEELGLTEAEIDSLRWAALLHDIGKLEIPFEILNKPDRLTAEEYETIKRHPGIGARLTAPLAGWLGDSVRAVSEHHERWDGDGYPNGLRGTDISLAARIVAVADTFDVMTSVRSYKKPGTAAEARAELARCAGTQFDANVVRAFLSVSLGKLRLAMGPLSWLTQLAFFPTGLVGAAAAAPALMAAAGMTAAALGTAAAPNTDTHKPSTRSAAVTVVDGAGEPDHTTVTVSVPTGGSHATTRPDVTNPGGISHSESTGSTTPVATTQQTVTGTNPQEPTVVPGGVVDQTVPISRNPTSPTVATTAAPRVPSPPTVATTAPPTTPPPTNAPPTTPPPTTAPPTTPPPTTAPPTTPPTVVSYLLASSAPGDVASQSVLPLLARAPLNSVLPNLDTDHDNSPGRLLRRSTGFTFGNTDKLQRFRLDPAGTISLNGPTSMVVFVAAKSFRTDDVQAQATLFDCVDAGGQCNPLATATVDFTGTDNEFARATFDFGSQTRTVAASHNLEVWIIATQDSEHDMWMAYDTTGFESALTITP